MSNQENFMEDDINNLKNKISILENENWLLKERLSEAGISYADIVGENAYDLEDTYDPDQGARIKKFEITDANEIERDGNSKQQTRWIRKKH